MADLLELGDVVKLRSGGPQMTITHGHGDMRTASWFDLGNHLCHGNFPQGALQLLATARSEPPPSRIYHHDFGWAIRTMEEGTSVRRVGWKDTWIDQGTESSSCIYVTGADGRTIWRPIHDDLFACDWITAGGS